jgi:hypothetical protein
VAAAADYMHKTLSFREHIVSKNRVRDTLRRG